MRADAMTDRRLTVLLACIASLALPAAAREVSLADPPSKPIASDVRLEVVVVKASGERKGDGALAIDKKLAKWKQTMDSARRLPR